MISELVKNSVPRLKEKMTEMEEEYGISKSDIIKILLGALIGSTAGAIIGNVIGAVVKEVIVPKELSIIKKIIR